MIVSLIAAMAANRTIGRENSIPWDSPADRRLFRELTMGHSLIVGRLTYESIGRPLPGRRMIVLTRKAEYDAPGCLVFSDLLAALRACAQEHEVFVGGGADLFRQALPYAARIHLTLLATEVAGDRFFPLIPEGFREVCRKELGGDPPATYLLLEKPGLVPQISP